MPPSPRSAPPTCSCTTPAPPGPQGPHRPPPDGTGYDVKRSTVEYRLAAFLDVTAYGGYRKYDGLQNIIEYPNKYSKTLVNDVQLHDILSIVQPTAAKNYGVKTGTALGRNIMAGIKFTVLFQLPEKRGCVICGDNYHGGGF